MKIFKWIIALFLPVFIYATDLTIVGTIKPEDGIGKIAINLAKTLYENISINLIRLYGDNPLPEYFSKRLSNDLKPGNVSILTHPICYKDNEFYKSIPNESSIKIAYTMFETDKFPESWVRILNDHFDCAVVPDDYILRICENSDLKIPVFVLPLSMDLEPYLSAHKHSYSKSKPFVFGDASANKNPIKLIRAFNMAFGNNPDVELHLRAGWQFINADIIQAKIDELGLKNVFLEFGYLNLSQYIEKLQSYDCYVNLSRGEGFSFIHRECLALGIPIISTNNTALKTLCDSGFVKSVPCDKLGPPNSIYSLIFDEDVGHQFDCKVKDVAKAMIEVYNDYKNHVKIARDGRNWVRKYDIINKSLRKKYRNLVKPIQVILGEDNVITDDYIMTNSHDLYEKYLQIMNLN